MLFCGLVVSQRRSAELVAAVDPAGCVGFQCLVVYSRCGWYLGGATELCCSAASDWRLRSGLKSGFVIVIA